MQVRRFCEDGEQFPRGQQISWLETPVSLQRIQNPNTPKLLKKLLKNYNLADPEPVLKITEKY